MPSAKERIIFALDVPSTAQAQHLVKQLGAHVGMFKIGLELFIQAGPAIVEHILRAGTAGIFLDLKLHDIPATVHRAVQRIADLGVAMTTVHCGESAAMLQAAVEGSQGQVSVLGVTVLTSVTANDLQRAGFKVELSTKAAPLVLQRAKMALAAGCAGIVCSGQEVGQLKRSLPASMIAVTPGIRLPAQQVAGDDQQRIMTPARAVQNGADYLVIGRPIRDAADPVATVRRIIADIESVADTPSH
jgi:orotidine-5'-phosphate decarboxylase